MTSDTTTIGQALANPASTIHSKFSHARDVMRVNRATVEALMEQGLTREQAWSELLREEATA